EPVVNYVATLADDKAQTAYVISGNAKQRTLTVRIVTAQQIGADKSLELWAIPKTGAPRSLGLVAANSTVTLALPADVTPDTVSALAVSLEPKGGSPNPNAPTGPVILKGAWVSV
ncbi:MAG TPA: anti-sigma factor, partial [Burkholderiaceae bacterium]